MCEKAGRCLCVTALWFEGKGRIYSLYGVFDGCLSTSFEDLQGFRRSTC